MAKEVQRDEMVFQACDRIIGRGLTLTTRNLRDELGGGSFSTLVPLISAYRTKLKSETAIRGALPLPPPELEILSKKLITDLWVKLKVLSETDAQDIEAKYQRRVDKLQKELEESKEEIAGHSAEITSLEQRSEKLRAELDRRVKQLAEKDGQLHLVSSQLQQKENDNKVLLERAVRAEAKLNFGPRSKKERVLTR